MPTVVMKGIMEFMERNPELQQIIDFKKLSPWEYCLIIIICGLIGVLGALAGLLIAFLPIVASIFAMFLLLNLLIQYGEEITSFFRDTVANFFAKDLPGAIGGFFKSQFNAFIGTIRVFFEGSGVLENFETIFRATGMSEIGKYVTKIWEDIVSNGKKTYNAIKDFFGFGYDIEILDSESDAKLQKLDNNVNIGVGSNKIDILAEKKKFDENIRNNKMFASKMMEFFKFKEIYLDVLCAYWTMMVGDNDEVDYGRFMKVVEDSGGEAQFCEGIAASIKENRLPYFMNKYEVDVEANNKIQGGSESEQIKETKKALRLGMGYVAYMSKVVLYKSFLSQFISATPWDSTPYSINACFPLPANVTDYSYPTGDDIASANCSSDDFVKKGCRIFVGRNTPIISPEDCKISRIGWDGENGWVIELISVNEQKKYSFMNMEDYPENLKQYKKSVSYIKEIGMSVRKGEVIGYVGLSGGSVMGAVKDGRPALICKIYEKMFSYNKKDFNIIIEKTNEVIKNVGDEMKKQGLFKNTEAESKASSVKKDESRKLNLPKYKPVSKDYSTLKDPEGSRDIYFSVNSYLILSILEKNKQF